MFVCENTRIEVAIILTVQGSDILISHQLVRDTDAVGVRSTEKAHAELPS